ncbi:MAG: class I SAM-dependent methyltransferase [Bacteroidota bacterium]
MTFQELVSNVEHSPNDLMVIDERKRYYRSKYGDDFSLDIAKTDEMFLHFYKKIENIPSKFSDHTRSWLNYFKKGEKISSSIMKLAENQFSKNNLKVLDFASGHGRVARFFKHMENIEITVSDIDGKAMEYSSNNLGLTTVQSSLNPEDTSFNTNFDLIYIISLFSHFAIEPWDSWMRKILGLLNEQGTLIFSYHGERLLKEVNKPLMKIMANGFYFYPANETRGRLDSDYYGTCYLTPTFLQNYFSKFPGLEVKIVEQGIGGMQDVCVIQKK